MLFPLSRYSFSSYPFSSYFFCSYPVNIKV